MTVESKARESVTGFSFTAQVDLTPHKAKPDRSEFVRIDGRLKKDSAVKKVTVGQLAEAIGGGASFMMSICPDRTNASWCECRGFCIDMDNDDAMKNRGYEPLSSRDALSRTAGYDLHPTIAYRTFSSTREAERYRFVYIFADAITDRATFEEVGAKLLDLFPEADEQTVEGERLFCGTDKKVIICDDAEILPSEEFAARVAKVKRRPPQNPPKSTKSSGKGKGGKKPKEVKEGGRHKYLHAEASSQLAKSKPYETALRHVRSENKARCRPPLPDDELLELVNDVYQRYDAGVSDDHAEKGGDKEPKHIGLVEAMKAHRFRLIDGKVPCIQHDGKTEYGWDSVESAMIAHNDWCTARTRKEAMQTLKHVGEHVKSAHARYIAFNNCVLNVSKMVSYTNDEFARMNEGVVPCVIPHDWDPDAEKDEAVETLLNGVSCNDEAIRMNLEEAAGLAISRLNGDRAKALWLFGTGQNGKSTYLDFLKTIVGEDNTASLDIDLFGGQFYLSTMLGKLLDVSEEKIDSFVSKETIGNVKKIVTGQAVKIEQKGRDAYYATIYATIMVSSNEPPKLADTTEGSTRRWHIIPFNARFKDDPTRDIDLIDRLQTEHAVQWMLRLAVDGLRRILKNGEMTPNEKSAAALQDMRERSNSVIAFLASYPREEFLKENNVEIWYWRYEAWAKGNGEKPFRQKQFSTTVCNEYGLKTENHGRYRSGDRCVMEHGIAHEHGRVAGEKYRIFMERG